MWEGVEGQLELSPSLLCVGGGMVALHGHWGRVCLYP